MQAHDNTKKKGFVVFFGRCNNFKDTKFFEHSRHCYFLLIIWIGANSQADVMTCKSRLHKVMVEISTMKSNPIPSTFLSSHSKI